ncbi:MAG TPA: VanZ family protein [Ramlibacter sp.]|nr:VanZ family protein [Ramlibacter sp.]
MSRSLLALSTGLVLALLVVPYPDLQLIRATLPWVGSASGWLDRLVPGLDMQHLVAFALLGALARFAQRRPRFGLAALWLGLFGLATELAQVWIPTRSARLDDLVLNVAGAVTGYAVGAAVIWLGRRRE